MRRTLLLMVLAIPISAELTYQKPPKEILDILNAPAPPALGVNPPRTYATLSQIGALSIHRRGLRAHAAAGRLAHRSAHQRPASGSGQHLHHAGEAVRWHEDPAVAAAQCARGPSALVARRKAVRLREHHRHRHRAVARRSRHRQDAERSKASSSTPCWAIRSIGCRTIARCW